MVHGGGGRCAEQSRVPDQTKSLTTAWARWASTSPHVLCCASFTNQMPFSFVLEVNRQSVTVTVTPCLTLPPPLPSLSLPAASRLTHFLGNYLSGSVFGTRMNHNCPSVRLCTVTRSKLPGPHPKLQPAPQAHLHPNPPSSHCSALHSPEARSGRGLATLDLSDQLPAPRGRRRGRRTGTGTTRFVSHLTSTCPVLSCPVPVPSRPVSTAVLSSSGSSTQQNIYVDGKM